MIELLKSLKTAGLKIDTVYDIGACIGEWSKAVKEHAFPDAQFYLFEANPALQGRLIEADVGRVIMGCLGAPGVEFVNFSTIGGTGDSYYREKSSHYDNAGSFRLPCFTLDGVMDGQGPAMPPPDVIKIDTQGAELDIFAGASKALRTATIIMCEVPFVPFNAGAPAIGEYLDFFRSHDFLPVRLPGATILEDILVHADIVFMRRDVKDKYLQPTTTLRL